MGSDCCKCSKNKKNITGSSSDGSEYRIRDGLPISSDRYQLSMRENIVQLALKQSRKNDTGLYSLVATRLGQESDKGALKKIHLTISEASYEESDPPVFLRRLSDLAVKVGTRTRFLVEIRSSTTLKVIWYKDDEPIYDGPRFSLVHEGNFHCVDVAPVTVEDQGCWTCMAENHGGRSSCTSTLTVIVPKAYKKPEFVEELRALLTETGTVSLECKVIGVPTPVLRWFKDNKEIKAGDVFALTANPDDPTSLGVYICEAVNCMGTANSSSKVHVVGRGSREGSLKPADTLTPFGPVPIFKQLLQDECCRIGDTIVLSCRVQVPPWPKAIAWYNKEGRIEPNEKYHIMEDGIGGYSIEIKQVEAMDEGEWKCVATSEDNMKQFTSCYVAMSIPRNYRKPRFMENLKAVLTEEGLVSFECKVVGFPTPLLRWFKDGQELKPGDVYQLTGTNSLGSYCCIARNCMGEARSTAELTIEDIQNQLNEEERFQLLSTNQPPKFIKGLRSCEARINEDFRFTVQVSVAPEPTLSWYRDDALVDESDKYHVLKENLGTCHFEVQKLEFIDQAEWKCVAANDFGHSVTSCFLKLIIPKHYKKPKFLESLRAILSEEGAVNLECKVIGVPQPVLKWYKDNVELKPGDIHRIISGQDGTCCLGIYTCEATNCMGTVSSSASLLGFEDKKNTKEIQSSNGHELARNLSLSTIHEERTSQLYDTPQTDHSVTLDERGEVSFSFDGKEVSVSLYETPDLTEEEALQIVEMYADQLSEHVTEHNVIELPPMRFVKETSTTGNLLMEAVVIDVSPDYFVSAEDGDDLRTEADFEDVSILDDITHVLSSPERDSRGSLKRSARYNVDEDEKAPNRPPRKKSTGLSSSKSEKSQRIESESFHSAQKDEPPLSPPLSLKQDDSDTFADALSSTHLSITESLIQKHRTSEHETEDSRKRSLSAGKSTDSSLDDGIGDDSSFDSMIGAPKKKQRKKKQQKDKTNIEEHFDANDYERRTKNISEDKVETKVAHQFIESVENTEISKNRNETETVKELFTEEKSLDNLESFTKSNSQVSEKIQELTKYGLSESKKALYKVLEIFYENVPDAAPQFSNIYERIDDVYQLLEISDELDTNVEIISNLEIHLNVLLEEINEATSMDHAEIIRNILEPFIAKLSHVIENLGSPSLQPTLTILKKFNDPIFSKTEEISNDEQSPKIIKQLSTTKELEKYMLKNLNIDQDLSNVHFAMSSVLEKQEKNIPSCHLIKSIEALRQSIGSLAITIANLKNPTDNAIIQEISGLNKLLLNLQGDLLMEKYEPREELILNDLMNPIGILKEIIRNITECSTSSESIVPILNLLEDIEKDAALISKEISKKKYQEESIMQSQKENTEEETNSLANQIRLSLDPLKNWLSTMSEDNVKQYKESEMESALSSTIEELKKDVSQIAIQTSYSESTSDKSLINALIDLREPLVRLENAISTHHEPKNLLILKNLENPMKYLLQTVVDVLRKHEEEESLWPIIDIIEQINNQISMSITDTFCQQEAKQNAKTFNVETEEEEGVMTASQETIPGTLTEIPSTPLEIGSVALPTEQPITEDNSKSMTYDTVFETITNEKQEREENANILITTLSETLEKLDLELTSILEDFEESTTQTTTIPQSKLANSIEELRRTISTIRAMTVYGEETDSYEEKLNQATLVLTNLMQPLTKIQDLIFQSHEHDVSELTILNRFIPLLNVIENNLIRLIIEFNVNKDIENEFKLLLCTVEEIKAEIPIATEKILLRRKILEHLWDISKPLESILERMSDLEKAAEETLETDVANILGKPIADLLRDIKITIQEVDVLNRREPLILELRNLLEPLLEFHSCLSMVQSSRRSLVPEACLLDERRSVILRAVDGLQKQVCHIVEVTANMEEAFLFNESLTFLSSAILQVQKQIGKTDYSRRSSSINISLQLRLTSTLNRLTNAIIALDEHADKNTYGIVSKCLEALQKQISFTQAQFNQVGSELIDEEAIVEGFLYPTNQLLSALNILKENTQKGPSALSHNFLAQLQELADSISELSSSLSAHKTGLVQEGTSEGAPIIETFSAVTDVLNNVKDSINIIKQTVDVEQKANVIITKVESVIDEIIEVSQEEIESVLMITEIPSSKATIQEVQNEIKDTPVVSQTLISENSEAIISGQAADNLSDAIKRKENEKEDERYGDLTTEILKFNSAINNLTQPLRELIHFVKSAEQESLISKSEENKRKIQELTALIQILNDLQATNISIKTIIASSPVLQLNNEFSRMEDGLVDFEKAVNAVILLAREGVKPELKEDIMASLPLISKSLSALENILTSIYQTTYEGGSIKKDGEPLSTIAKDLILCINDTIKSLNEMQVSKCVNTVDEKEMEISKVKEETKDIEETTARPLEELIEAIMESQEQVKCDETLLPESSLSSMDVIDAKGTDNFKSAEVKLNEAEIEEASALLSFAKSIEITNEQIATAKQSTTKEEVNESDMLKIMTIPIEELQSTILKVEDRMSQTLETKESVKTVTLECMMRPLQELQQLFLTGSYQDTVPALQQLPIKSILDDLNKSVAIIQDQVTAIQDNLFADVNTDDSTALKDLARSLGDLRTSMVVLQQLNAIENAGQQIVEIENASALQAFAKSVEEFKKCCSVIVERPKIIEAFTTNVESRQSNKVIDTHLIENIIAPLRILQEQISTIEETKMQESEILNVTEMRKPINVLSSLVGPLQQLEKSFVAIVQKEHVIEHDEHNVKVKPPSVSIETFTLQPILEEIQKSIASVQEHVILEAGSQITSEIETDALLKSIAQPLVDLKASIASIQQVTSTAPEFSDELAQEQNISALETFAESLHDLTERIAMCNHQQIIMEPAIDTISEDASSLNTWADVIDESSSKITRPIVIDQGTIESPVEIAASISEDEISTLKMLAKPLTELREHLSLIVEEQKMIQPYDTTSSLSEKENISLMKTVVEPLSELQHAAAIIIQEQMAIERANENSFSIDNKNEFVLRPLIEPLEELRHSIAIIQDQMVVETSTDQSINDIILNALAEPLFDLQRAISVLETRVISPDIESMSEGTSSNWITECLATSLQEIERSIADIQQYNVIEPETLVAKEQTRTLTSDWSFNESLAETIESIKSVILRMEHDSIETEILKTMEVPLANMQQNLTSLRSKSNLGVEEKIDIDEFNESLSNFEDCISLVKEQILDKNVSKQSDSSKIDASVFSTLNISLTELKSSIATIKESQHVNLNNLEKPLKLLQNAVETILSAQQSTKRSELSTKTEDETQDKKIEKLERKKEDLGKKEEIKQEEQTEEKNCGKTEEIKQQDEQKEKNEIKILKEEDSGKKEEIKQDERKKKNEIKISKERDSAKKEEIKPEEQKEKDEIKILKEEDSRKKEEIKQDERKEKDEIKISKERDSAKKEEIKPEEQKEKDEIKILKEEDSRKKEEIKQDERKEKDEIKISKEEDSGKKEEIKQDEQMERDEIKILKEEDSGKKEEIKKDERKEKDEIKISKEEDSAKKEEIKLEEQKEKDEIKILKEEDSRKKEEIKQDERKEKDEIKISKEEDSAKKEEIKQDERKEKDEIKISKEEDSAKKEEIKQDERKEKDEIKISKEEDSAKKKEIKQDERKEKDEIKISKEEDSAKKEEIKQDERKEKDEIKISKEEDSAKKEEIKQDERKEKDEIKISKEEDSAKKKEIKQDERKEKDEIKISKEEDSAKKEEIKQDERKEKDEIKISKEEDSAKKEEIKQDERKERDEIKISKEEDSGKKEEIKQDEQMERDEIKILKEEDSGKKEEIKKDERKEKDEIKISKEEDSGKKEEIKQDERKEKDEIKISKEEDSAKKEEIKPEEQKEKDEIKISKKKDSGKKEEIKQDERKEKDEIKISKEEDFNKKDEMKQEERKEKDEIKILKEEDSGKKVEIKQDERKEEVEIKISKEKDSGKKEEIKPEEQKEKDEIKILKEKDSSKNDETKQEERKEKDEIKISKEEDSNKGEIKQEKQKGKDEIKISKEKDSSKKEGITQEDRKDKDEINISKKKDKKQEEISKVKDIKVAKDEQVQSKKNIQESKEIEVKEEIQKLKSKKDENSYNQSDESVKMQIDEKIYQKQQEKSEPKFEKLERTNKEEERKQYKPQITNENQLSTRREYIEGNEYKVLQNENDYQKRNNDKKLLQKEMEHLEKKPTVRRAKEVVDYTSVTDEERRQKRNEEKKIRRDETARLLREEEYKLRKRQEEERLKNRQRKKEQLRENEWSAKRENESDRFLKNVLETTYKPNKSISSFFGADYSCDYTYRFDSKMPMLSSTSRSYSWRDSLTSLSGKRLDDYWDYKLHSPSMDRYYFDTASSHRRRRKRENRMIRARSISLLKYDGYSTGDSDATIVPNTYARSRRRTKTDTLSHSDFGTCESKSYTDLHQSESFSWDKPKKPSFCTRLTNRIVGPGMRTRLTCTVLGNPEPRVYWMKNDQKLDTSDGRYKIRCENGMAYLELYDALPEDAGIYTCVAENTHGTSTTESILRVYSDYKSTHASPIFITLIKDTYRYSDHKLILECRVRAHPIPTISWLKEGTILQGERYKQSCLDDDVYRLEIADPNITDNGQYTCRATNELHTEEMSHIVHVEDWQAVNRNDPYLSAAKSEFAQRPQFSNLLKDYSVPTGGTIALQVKVKGTPFPEVKWLRGDRKEPITIPKARTFAERGLHTLIVPDATESERGLYVCRAINVYGQVDTSATVNVISSSAIDGGKPAVFVSRPSKKSIDVIVGEDISISFRASGIPKPRIIWMKGLTDITDGPRSYKETIDDYVRLILKRVTPSDEGTYCILVKNRYGCDRSFFSIKVKQRARSLTPLSDWNSVAERDAEEYDKEMSYVRNVPGPISSEPVAIDGGKSWLSLSWGKAERRGPAPVIAYKVEAWQLGGEGGARWVELGVTPINAFDAFNLRPGGEYKFRVTPRNRYGWGEPVTMTNSVSVMESTDLPEFTKILPGQLKALEGAPVKLECEIRGDSKTEIRWYRDTTEINPCNDSRFSIYRDGSKYSLTIANVKEDDTGRYVCEATNRIGKVSSFARILVVTDPRIIEADAKLKTSLNVEPEDRPPHFTMRIRDRRVQTTYPVRLTCQAIGHPVPEITWYKNGIEIDQDDRHVFWDDDSNFHTLEIIHSVLEDSGCYMVTARNINGSVSCRCTLVVDKGIRAYVAPEFLRDLDAIYTIHSGEELRMSAQLEAYPSVGVVWHRDGIRLRPSRRAIMTLSHDGTVQFSLANVTTRDAGVYSCTATNVVGQTETSTRVAVTAIEDQSIDESSNVASPDIPYSKEPLFVTKPLSTEAIEGDTVVILCEVVGDPKPEVIWLRDFLKPDYYKDAPHFRLVGAGPQYRLEIPYAKLDFTGTYSVIARNCHGEAKAVISLQIYAKGQGKEKQTQKSRHGKVLTLPIIKRDLRDLRCCDGDAVSLECKVYATPEPPLIRWERGGKIIAMVGDFSTDFDGETAQLNIQHVYPEDEGEYTCVAYNDLGKAYTSACLVVDVPEGKENILSQRLARPMGLLSAGSTPRSTPRSTPIRSLSPAVPHGREFKSPQVLSRGGTSKRPKVCPPKFYAVPHNCLVQEGETVRFQCSVVGHPAPWIKWDKNGTTVTPSTRISVKERDDIKVLEIVDVMQEDAALYRITAENDFGRIEASARLEVINRYEPTSRAIRTRSASPRTYPSFERSLLPTTARINNRLQLECRVKGTPSVTPTWHRNGRPLERSSRIKKYFDGTTARIEISKVKASDAGEYTCIATNILGSTRNSCQVTILDPYDSSIADKNPPQFLQSLPKESIVMENHCYEFQTGVTGTPPFTIIWSKDGRELPDNDYYKYVVYGDGGIALRIAEVCSYDAGEYTCTVQNDYGTACCSSLFAVQDYKTVSKMPLQFTKTPLSVIAAKGSTAYFCARVQCGKSMEIIWTINGKDARENVKCKIEKDGNVSILKIRDVSLRDAGEVRCVASVNGKGPTISCIAKLHLHNSSYNYNDFVMKPENIQTYAEAKPSSSRRSHEKLISRIRSSSFPRHTTSCTKHISPLPIRKRISNNASTDIQKSRFEDDLSVQRVIGKNTDDGQSLSSKKTELCHQNIDFISIKEQVESRLEELKATIIREQTDIRIFRGNTAALSITYQGYPEPTVKWFRVNRELRPDEKIRIVSGNGVSYLTLDDVTYDHAGKYQVSVENSLGQDQRFFSLAVEGPPEPPADKPSAITSGTDQITIAWRSPPYDGGRVVIGYTVEAKRVGESTWMVVAESCHSLSHTVGTTERNFVVTGESYYFRVRAENIHGLSEPSMESDPVKVLKQGEMLREEEDEFESNFKARLVVQEEGKLFGERYDVLEELGKGRYGVVKKVIERSTNTNFAAKFVKTIKAKDREQVREEIKIMNVLRHPKLLLLVAAYEKPRETVLVTEYISGGELFERVVADDFTLTEKDSILFMRQICQGVEYMHRNNIVHLDLKPENIMCRTRTSHQIKLIDFGLAQTLKSDTPIRVLFGTPEFIPPEIISYEPIGTESDMWSVGVICYVLLTGLSPFMGDNDAETFANITRADYDLEDEAFDAISNDAKNFISGLLIKRKELRMSAGQCLEHPWMVQHATAMSRVVLPTEKLKKFIIRRKWQKTGNAIRALGRMANLSAYNRRSPTTAESSPTLEQRFDSIETQYSSDGVESIHSVVDKDLEYDEGSTEENSTAAELQTNLDSMCLERKLITIPQKSIEEGNSSNNLSKQINIEKKNIKLTNELIPKVKDNLQNVTPHLKTSVPKENEINVEIKDKFFGIEQHASLRSHTLRKVFRGDSRDSGIGDCSSSLMTSPLQVDELGMVSIIKEEIDHEIQNRESKRTSDKEEHQRNSTADLLESLVQDKILPSNREAAADSSKVSVKSDVTKASYETNPMRKVFDENTDTRISRHNRDKLLLTGNVSRTARMFERENESIVKSSNSNNLQVSMPQRSYPASIVTGKPYNERIQKAFAFWNK
ncbi:hypothetical protein PUN28_019519 [Cardiocondyla obscurior]|uniref:Titin homolog n=1 Tax=Cardiocondyla obscurior TaxID=286306 RepID=A0AAW2EBM5_9HYME